MTIPKLISAIAYALNVPSNFTLKSVNKNKGRRNKKTDITCPGMRKLPEVQVPDQSKYGSLRTGIAVCA